MMSETEQVGRRPSFWVVVGILVVLWSGTLLAHPHSRDVLLRAGIGRDLRPSAGNAILSVLLVSLLVLTASVLFKRVLRKGMNRSVYWYGAVAPVGGGLAFLFVLTLLDMDVVRHGLFSSLQACVLLIPVWLGGMLLTVGWLIVPLGIASAWALKRVSSV